MYGRRQVKAGKAVYRMENAACSVQAYGRWCWCAVLRSNQCVAGRGKGRGQCTQVVEKGRRLGEGENRWWGAGRAVKGHVGVWEVLQVGNGRQCPLAGGRQAQATRMS